jgi:RNA polymerase sigma-70 factor (ECF subfamily)
MAKPLHSDVCNEKRYASLYHNLSQSLHDFVYYKYGNKVNAEDKVHEAFIKLWKNCQKVSPDKAKSYLFTVINNLSLNEIKHQKVVLNYQNQATNKPIVETPQFVLEEKEFMERLQRALENLPEKQRIAFMLNRVEGKRHKEIADILNISRKAVEKRIYTALENLRKEIDGI